jgi:hypothetical protein
LLDATDLGAWVYRQSSPTRSKSMAPVRPSSVHLQSVALQIARRLVRETSRDGYLQRLQTGRGLHQRPDAKVRR